MANPLFSLTKEDFEWEFFRGSGPGGQNRNKRDTGCRCRHLPSGAIGRATEHRTQGLNRKAAFKRMAESKEFQTWVKRKAAGAEEIERTVEKSLSPENLRVEVMEEGKWTSAPNVLSKEE